MRVAADFSFIASGGLVAHLEAWVQHTAVLDPENEYFLLSPREVPEVLETLPPNFRWVRRVLHPLPPEMRIFWEQLWLPLWLRVNHIDVLFSVADRTSVLAPCPTVMLIQNLKPYGGPAPLTLKGRLREWMLRKLTWISARTARRVLFVSDSAQDIVCRRLGIPRSKTCVIYHGVDAAFFAPPDANAADEFSRLPTPYVLTVAAVLPHKGLETLIDAYHLLTQNGDFADHSLVIAAPIVDRTYCSSLIRRVERLGLGARVRFIGQVPRGSLPSLYQRSSAFAFPSLTESFGLPLIEAMAAGVPVVASDIPAAREVCDDAALYFPPLSPSALAEALRAVLTKEALHHSLRARGIARAATFSWAATAEQTLHVLRSVFLDRRGAVQLGANSAVGRASATQIRSSAAAAPSRTAAEGLPAARTEWPSNGVPTCEAPTLQPARAPTDGARQPN